MSVEELPFEVVEFERLLRKPNSDPTRLAGFFNSGEIIVARVPDDFVRSLGAFRQG